MKEQVKRDGLQKKLNLKPNSDPNKPVLLNLIQGFLAGEVSATKPGLSSSVSNADTKANSSSYVLPLVLLWNRFLLNSLAANTKKPITSIQNDFDDLIKDDTFKAGGLII